MKELMELIFFGNVNVIVEILNLLMEQILDKELLIIVAVNEAPVKLKFLKY